MTKPRETFHFKPPIQVKGNWTIGLTDLEVYNSKFNITEENNKFKLYKFPDEKSGGVTYEKVRDEIEKDLDIEDITAADLQDEITAPIIIEVYKKQVTKRMKDDKYMNIVAGYVGSVFQDFEGFLRTEVDLIEDDIELDIELNWNTIQVFSLMKFHPVFTLLKIFPKLFLTFFKLNTQDLVTLLILNLMTSP